MQRTPEEQHAIDLQACRAKRFHKTKRLAKEFAAIENRTSAVHIRVYECEFCRGWHLTKSPAEQQRQRRREM